VLAIAAVITATTAAVVTVEPAGAGKRERSVQAIPPILDDLLRLAANALRGESQYTIRATAKTVGAVLRDRSSQEQVHQHLAALFERDLAGEWVVRSVCASVAYSDRENVTFNGTSWRYFVKDVLKEVANDVILAMPLTKWLAVIKNAEARRKHLLNTWRVSEMNPRLARWYWQACKG
jgi:hypothetical protein